MTLRVHVSNFVALGARARPSWDGGKVSQQGAQGKASHRKTAERERERQTDRQREIERDSQLVSESWKGSVLQTNQARARIGHKREPEQQDEDKVGALLNLTLCSA